MDQQQGNDPEHDPAPDEDNVFRSFSDMKFIKRQQAYGIQTAHDAQDNSMAYGGEEENPNDEL